jgi:hypothetical protein
VNHEEPRGTLIEVPGDKGQVATRPFGECSVEQMRKALQRKRKPTSSKPLPAETEQRADQYREAVTSRFPKGTRVQVLVRNENGKAVLDFKGIPMEQVLQRSPEMTHLCSREVDQLEITTSAFDPGTRGDAAAAAAAETRSPRPPEGDRGLGSVGITARRVSQSRRVGRGRRS